jgi:hypothetical protein
VANFNFKAEVAQKINNSGNEENCYQNKKSHTAMGFLIVKVGGVIS